MSDDNRPMPVISRRTRSLDESIQRWLAVGALVCGVHGTVDLLLAYWWRWSRPDHVMTFQPWWTSYFFIVYHVTVAAFLLLGLLVLLRSRAWTVGVWIAVAMTALETVNHFWFDRLYNFSHKSVIQWLYGSFADTYDVLHFQLVAVFAVIVLRRSRRNVDSYLPAEVVRWIAMLSIVCGAYWWISAGEWTIKNLFNDVRYLTRPSAQEIGQALLGLGALCWVVGGWKLLRHRPGGATDICVASLLWTVGAVVYLVLAWRDMMRVSELPPRVYSAFHFIAAFLYGFLFSAVVAVALRRDDVRAVLPQRARRGFAPIFPKGGDVAAG